MEKEIKKQDIFERFGLEPVPAELLTTSWFEYFYIQVAFSVNAGNFLVPALAVLEGGLTFSQAVLSTVLGAIFAFFFVSWLSFPGATNGIPAQYAIRSIIGMKGAQYISSPIRTLTSLYWFSVQTIGGTYLVKEMVERLFQISIPFYLISFLLAATMSILALVGFDLIKKLTRYFIPILLLGQITIFYLLVTSASPVISTMHASNAFSVSSFIFFSGLTFVQYVSGVSASSDMARFSKSKKHSFWGIFTGNVTGFTLTAILAAFTATRFHDVNPFVVSTTLTNSYSILLLISVTAIISMLSINMNNAYTGGFSLLNSIPRLGRIKSAITFGVLGITLSCFPTIVTEAKQYITLLGGFIIPLSAVIVTEFIIFKKSKMDITDLETMYKENFNFNKQAMIAIILGMILYFLLEEAYSPGILVFMITSVFYTLYKYASIKFITKKQKSPLSM
ncbi:purine-cytosine permease family protein [Bacillus suaedaesalsae]|uniref:Cytosine permease n=1 Tax=Bacillus suaedaesalsae TaxID=2810349 RepID=A0ABS2DG57_9BACI|nr:cytosine permease [Bacillus suaedaesalsae]MBM6617468.1 cytosine permease [Bacillus suaedaesalsae]